MAHLKGPEKAPPKRPFAVSMFGSVMRLGAMLDALRVCEVHIQMPRAWGESSTIEHYSVTVRTPNGTVTRKHKDFAGAFASVIASLELWEQFDETKGSES